MTARFGLALSLAIAFGFASSASAQFQTRWRDQRLPQSRPSPYLSLLTPGSNRAVVYQGFVRPQLDLQSQIRTQERQIDRFTATSRDTPAFGDYNARGTPQQSRGLSQGLLQSGTVDRLRGPTNDLRTIDVGHPVYFQYREQYFPGFRRNTVTQ